MAHKTMEGTWRRKEGALLSNFARAGEREKERGASSFFGLEPDLPSMLLDQLPAQIEAQPRSADAGGTRIPRTNKTPKEMRLLLRRYAYSLIADTEARFVLLSVFLKRYLDRAATRAVFYGIGEQIGKHLLNPGGVDRCPELGTGRVQSEIVQTAGRLELADYPAGERDQVGGLWF